MELKVDNEVSESFQGVYKINTLNTESLPHPIVKKILITNLVLYFFAILAQAVLFFQMWFVLWFDLWLYLFLITAPLLINVITLLVTLVLGIISLFKYRNYKWLRVSFLSLIILLSLGVLVICFSIVLVGTMIG